MTSPTDGWGVIEQMRAEGVDIPVIVLSARSSEHDKVHTLGIGADDYLAKPASMRELVARVEAQLRAGRRLKQAREEVRQHAEETAARDEMVDILHEVTDALAPEEIYHILTRRVAKEIGRAHV
mgnify:CR=1 FL=1